MSKLEIDRHKLLLSYSQPLRSFLVECLSWLQNDSDPRQTVDLEVTQLSLTSVAPGTQKLNRKKLNIKKKIYSIIYSELQSLIRKISLIVIARFLYHYQECYSRISCGTSLK